MLAEQIGQREVNTRNRWSRAGVGVGEHQVVRQHDPVTGTNRSHLVAAVGVERDERQLVLRGSVDLALAAVRDDQRSPGECAGEGDDQRGDHPVVLLRVLVRTEELAPGVHEHRVQLCDQSTPDGQAEIGGDAVQNR